MEKVGVFPGFLESNPKPFKAFLYHHEGNLIPSLYANGKKDVINFTNLIYFKQN